MRAVTDRAAQLIDGGAFQVKLIATTFYGSELTLDELDLTSWSIGAERGRELPSTGKVQVSVAPKDGVSLTPQDYTDFLAPFGQEVQVQVEVSGSRKSLVERIPYGYFRIGETPEAHDSKHLHGTKVITVSSRITLELVDPLERVRAAGFTAPSRPPSGATCWSELARLTGMKIARSVPDQSLPQVEYELEQGGRLKACQLIAARLGGTLYTRPDGALTVLPNAAGEPVKRIPIGTRGLSLNELARSLSNDGVYNEVVGKFEDANGVPIVVPAARITSGPLSVNGPLGARTRYYASEFVKTAAQARSAVQAILEQSSTLKAVRLPVSIPFDPRLEVGDTVEVEHAEETLRGTIETLDIGNDLSMELGIAITSSYPEPNLAKVRRR